VTDLTELLNQLPTAAIAAKLGVDESTADAAIRQALPALLGGLHANAQHPAAAASLAAAVGQHSSSLVDGGVDVDQVDTADGDKIVGHVFGDHRDAVVQQVAASAPESVTSSLVAKLLPLLAPIVMSYLAKQVLGGKGGAAASGGLGNVLGGVLGSMLGGAGAGSAPAGGLDLGSILGGLGGLLGGGRR
jgi:hypothetical protein